MDSKIQQIKEVRRVTGCSLVLAKKIVDYVAAQTLANTIQNAKWSEPDITSVPNHEDSSAQLTADNRTLMETIDKINDILNDHHYQMDKNRHYYESQTQEPPF